jgi:ABC-2 type transport system permease protein
MKTTFARELNAIWALAGREVTNAIKNPIFLIFTLFFPVIFLGLMGGTLSQNLGSALGFDLMRFMFIGMLASSLYQGAMNGMISLVEDRENDFTQEIFVSPVSRYSIMLGKAVGASIVSFVGLIGLVAMALVMQIHMQWSDLWNILLLAPILSMAGAALGTFFIGFVQNPKVAGIAGFMLIFPQMFLSGAVIPVQNSTGILSFFVHIMPMTYLIDLSRHLFYAGDAAAKVLIQHSVYVDGLVTLGFFLAFTIIGTFFFARSEKNR